MNKSKPNLIYIFADQWRYQAMGFVREDPVKTPHIDAFATESKVFTNAVSTYPLCSPHRASLLTGKYPYSCGMWTNCKTGLDEVLMLKPQETTIANVLKEQGYATGYIGKWHLDASELNFTQQPVSGAKGWGAYTPPGERRQGFDFWMSYGAMDEHLNPYYYGDTPEQIKPGKWSVEYETDVALDYIKKEHDKGPFALFISYNPPHSPYHQVPQRYQEMYKDMEIDFRPNVPQDLRGDEEVQKLKDYYAAVSGIDENFGRILDYLRQLDLEEDTIIVLSSDHGDMLNSHRYSGKNVWYEESLHIPFMIRYPRVLTPGTLDAMIGSQDHMPTLLELMDITVPDTCQGVSLSGIAKEETDQEPQQECFICMIPGMPELVEAYTAQGLNHKCFGWRGIRTKSHTYVVYNGIRPGQKQKRMLYDRKIDPYELNPREINFIDDKVTRGESLNNPFILQRDKELDIDTLELTRYLDERLSYYLEKTKDPFLLERGGAF